MLVKSVKSITITIVFILTEKKPKTDFYCELNVLPCQNLAGQNYSNLEFGSQSQPGGTFLSHRFGPYLSELEARAIGTSFVNKMVKQENLA